MQKAVDTRYHQKNAGKPDTVLLVIIQAMFWPIFFQTCGILLWNTHSELFATQTWQAYSKPNNEDTEQAGHPFDWPCE